MLFDTRQYEVHHYGHDDNDNDDDNECNHHWITTLSLDNLPIKRCKRCFREQELHPESDSREIYQQLIKPFEKRLATYQQEIERAIAPSFAKSYRQAYKELKPVVDSLWRFIGIDPDREGSLLFDRLIVREQVVREQPEDCTLTEGNLPNGKSVREQVVREQPEDCTLTTGHWIEEKNIKRGNKTHGPYLYERWRDGTGKLRSKYLGKKK